MRIVLSDRALRLAQFIDLPAQQLVQPLVDAHARCRGRFPLHLIGLKANPYLSVTIDATVLYALKLSGFLDESSAAAPLKAVIGQSCPVGVDGRAWEAGAEGVNVWTTALCGFALRCFKAPLPDGVVPWLLAAQNGDGGWGYLQGDTSRAIYTFYALKALGEEIDPACRQRAEIYAWRLVSDSRVALFERVLAASCLSREKLHALGGKRLEALFDEFRVEIGRAEWVEESESYESTSGHVIKGMRWALLPALMAMGMPASDGEIQHLAQRLKEWMKFEDWPPEFCTAFAAQKLADTHVYSIGLFTLSAWVERVFAAGDLGLLGESFAREAHTSTAAHLAATPSVLSAVKIGDIKDKVSVVIICVRDDEFEAVLRRFPNRQLVTGGRNLYDHCLMRSGTRKVGVAVCRCAEQGTSSAQTVTANAIDDLNPAWIFLVGIAGAFPDSDYTLGDVVVATRLADFSVSAALQDKPAEFDQRGGPMHPDVQRIAAHIPTLSQHLQGWSRAPALVTPRPVETIGAKPSAKNYYGSASWKKKVHKSLSLHFPAGNPAGREPKVLAAANISSNALLKDAELADQWKRSARSAATVEMELAGAYQAVYGKNQHQRLLSVRGISDVVGYKRNPAWTAYACDTAASFAHALLVSGLLFEA